MPNNNLLLNSFFQVNIGTLTYSFTRIKNISEVIEVEAIQEGGNNWSVHNIPKPISSSHKLVMERGVMIDGDDFVLTPGSRVYNVTIMVMKDGKIQKSYSFDEGIITHWEISDFDALQGQIIYNTVEILHSGLKGV